MAILGFDIGGSSIKVILREKENILKKQVFKFSPSLEGVLEKVEEIYQRFSQKEKIEKIGIGIAGILDKDRRKVLRAPNLPFLDGIKIREEIENKLKRKIKIENDVNCFLLAEKRLGLAKNLKNCVLIALGSGIGGGILIDGKLLKGEFGAGGEVGHIVLDLKNFFEFEDLASNKFLKRKLNLTAKETLTLARKGNKEAIEAFEEFGRYLGIGISNIINILDPGIIILAGGISIARKFFEKEMKAQIQKFVVSPAAKKTKILFSKFARYGGAIGASFL